MVMQAQMGGQVFIGWDESASKIKTCLHSLEISRTFHLIIIVSIKLNWSHFKCMLYILLWMIHPCMVKFFHFYSLFLTFRTWSSGEMTDVSLVMYARILQSFSVHKTHLANDCKLAFRSAFIKSTTERQNQAPILIFFSLIINFTWM